jgi:hypothetical protein
MRARIASATPCLRATSRTYMRLTSAKSEKMATPLQPPPHRAISRGRTGCAAERSRRQNPCRCSGGYSAERMVSSSPINERTSSVAVCATSIRTPSLFFIGGGYQVGRLQSSQVAGKGVLRRPSTRAERPRGHGLAGSIMAPDGKVGGGWGHHNHTVKPPHDHSPLTRGSSQLASSQLAFRTARGRRTRLRCPTAELNAGTFFRRL